MGARPAAFLNFDDRDREYRNNHGVRDRDPDRGRVTRASRICSVIRALVTEGPQTRVSIVSP